VLDDFDEGKRSCRFKLERHNNRRRRKVQEFGEDAATPAGENDKASLIIGMCKFFVYPMTLHNHCVLVRSSSCTWVDSAAFLWLYQCFLQSS
jgi:hypothetical protein